MTLLGRLAGIERIETELLAQNAATSEHREWEGKALRDLKSEAESIKDLATKTNGRVNDHDVQLGVIKEAERQAAIIQAAKVKAEAEVKAKRLSWRQGLTFVGVSASLTTVGLGALYVLHVIPH